MNRILRSVALVLVAATPFASATVGGSPTKSESAPVANGSIKGEFVSLQRLKTRGATSQRDVVVYLEAEDAGPFTPPSKAVDVKQHKLQFEPHVLPVLAGSSVRFSNDDTVKHNVYSSESCCKVDVDMDAGGDDVRVFDQAGVASIVCRLHPEMSLWVVVLETPWFDHLEVEKVKVDGKSTYKGAFELKDVPPGKYTLTYWNKKLKPQKFPVTVEAGVETKFDIRIEE